MRSLSFLQFVPDCITRFNRGVGQSVAWLTVALAFTTASIVLLRLLFDFGGIGLQESLTYMHALVIMLASAYTLADEGHVRVDIFYRRLSKTGKAWVNTLGSALFLLPFAIFTVLISLQYVCASWSMRESSADAGGIAAVFLLKSLIICNGGLLALQALAAIMQNLLDLTFSADQE